MTLDGARVLDLYAGSGALGLEAASRGAGHVVLVEKDRAAARVVRANTDLVKHAWTRSTTSTAPPQITVAIQAVQTYLDTSGRSMTGSTDAAAAELFDLVFIDPPYDVGNDALLDNLKALAPLLVPDALVVVERSPRSGEPQYPDTLELVRQKSYGDTALFWLGPAPNPPPAPPAD